MHFFLFCLRLFEGAGQDVGRSCLLLQMGGKNIMLDCGMHMGFQDERKFPDMSYVGEGDLTEILDCVIITHFHLDHLIGLPCFAPLYNPTAQMTLMGDGSRHEDWKEAMRTLIGAPFWPGEVETCGGPKKFLDLPQGNGPIDIYGARISWCPVFHPQGCLAYKIEIPDSTIVIATDHEHGESDVSAGFLDFCRDADSLIYDAMYTPSEYLTHSGWGHGNWEQGVQLAMEAGVRELILTHHDYKRTDSQIDAIVRESQKYFERTRGAMENMVLASRSAEMVGSAYRRT